MDYIAFQFVPYLWLSAVLLLMTGALLVYALRNRRVWGVSYFACSLGLVMLWIIAQGLEIAALAMPAKLFFANLQYLSIMLLPVAYLYLTLAFTNREDWLHRTWLLPGLLLLPVLLFILLWTDPWHGLIRHNLQLVRHGATLVLEKDFGVIFWGFAAYNYGVSLFTLLLLLFALQEQESHYAYQVKCLVLALLFPILATAAHNFGIDFAGIDATPAAFGLSSIVIAWGIFRYRLFDVVPIARSLLMQELRVGVIVLDEEGRMLDYNPAAQTIFALPEPTKAVGTSIELYFQEMPQLTTLFQRRSRDIQEICLAEGKGADVYEVTLNQLRTKHGRGIGWMLQAYDITDRKQKEEAMRHAALHDSMTGLPNRSFFKQLLEERIALAKKRGSFFLAYLDLDDFKMINDCYGHDVGDQYLQEVATRLLFSLPEANLVARFGGDEFAVLLTEASGPDAAQKWAEELLACFATGALLEGDTVPIRVSIGFASYPQDGVSVDELLKKADRAMYQVKARKDKNGWAFYQPKHWEQPSDA